MSFIEVLDDNTFEWKIKHNNDDCVFWSDEFAIDGYCFCLLHTVPNFYSYGPQYSSLRQFCLCPNDSSFLPFSYIFSIFDRKGQYYISTKGKIMKREEEWPLMIIDYDDLRKRNIINKDFFIVRFTRCQELDAKEIPRITVKPSNVADSSTKTNSCVTKDSSTNTDGVDTRLLETLSNDFSTLYENKTDTDCVLKVNDEEFNAHRAVLSARSSVFSAMFHHDTAENRSGEVNIPDLKATALSDVLYYVYSGKIRGLTADTATSIYTVADKYDLPELRTECLEFLKRNLTMDNFCHVAILAHTHGEMELEERVVWFIEENLDEVLESSSWQQFSKDKTLLANKLLTRGFKAAKKKLSRGITSK